MSFNDVTIPVYRKAIELMFSSKPVDEGMNELVAISRALAPHRIWESLLAMTFPQELPTLSHWLTNELLAHESDAAILFFSLSDMGDEMSLFGGRQVQKSKSRKDRGIYQYMLWADAPSLILRDLYQMAEERLSDGKGGYTHSDVRWIIECCFPLAYAGLAIGTILRALPNHILTGKDERRRVAIFFAEGDEFFFGDITRSGFEYCSPPTFNFQ